MGLDRPGYLRRDCPDPAETTSSKKQSVQSRKGAFSATGGNPAAMQTRIQSASMSLRGNTVAQGQTTGARPAGSGCAVVLVKVSRNVAQDVELPSELVLQVNDCIPAWRTLVSMNGSERQAAGLHVGEPERWSMIELSVSGAKCLTACSVKTSSDTGSGMTSFSAGEVQSLKRRSYMSL